MLGLLTKIGFTVVIFAALLECSAKMARNTRMAENGENDTPNVKNEMENEESTGKPKLTVSFNAKETSLEVEYKVKNTADVPIYLFNVIMHTDEIETLSPHKFYSCLRDDGTVVLAKAIPKLPSIATVEVRDIPYTTKVEAGKEFTEKVDIPLPLEEYSPYFQKDHDSKVELRTAENIYLVLQFIREKDGLKVKETKIANAFDVDHDDLFGNVETLKSEKRPTSIKVNRRLDTFERF